jgi:hypothetical protein
MGGGVFPFESRRLSKADHARVAGDLICELSRVGWRAQLVPSYRSKPDFGDVDLIVSGTGNLTDSISTLVGYRQHSKNDNCLSFLRFDVQVDLICVPEEEGNMTLTYLAWNDLGNLMGRVARRMGFRYGHRGLFLDVKDCEGSCIGRVILSRDPRKIFHFMGYNFGVWELGFDELQDIFRFACSTLFVDNDCFFARDLNHAARVRSKKRTTYALFIEWISGQHLRAGGYPKAGDGFWRARADDFFGEEWRREEEKIIASHHYEKQKKRGAVDGRVISELTGLKGRDLGICIKALRGGLGKHFELAEAKLTREEADAIFRRVKGAGNGAEVLGREAALEILKALCQADLQGAQGSRETDTLETG